MSLPMLPALSRTTISAQMAARGMRPAAELGATKPCGTRLRYYAGCRCGACRRANADYEAQRAQCRRRGERNGLVSAERARQHLLWLSSRGVGHKTAADAAKVAASTVSKVVYGQRLKIRERTERQLLAVTPQAAADRALVDAAPTWRLLDELIDSGYPRARLASLLLGRPVRALQVSRKLVQVRTADAVRRLHERLRYADAGTNRQALHQLQELRDEGYLQTRVLAAMAAEAERRGWPAPTLQPAGKGTRAGCVRHQEAVLLDHLHKRLLAEEGTTA